MSLSNSKQPFQQVYNKPQPRCCRYLFGICSMDSLYLLLVMFIVQFDAILVGCLQVFIVYCCYQPIFSRSPSEVLPS